LFHITSPILYNFIILLFKLLNKKKDNPIIYFRLSFSIPSATIKALVKAQERL